MPVPFIFAAVAVAAATVSYFSARKTGTCSSCNADLRPIKFNHSACTKCRAVTCNSCLVSIQMNEIPASILPSQPPLCPACIKTVQNDIDRYQTAQIEANSIKIFPETFKGKTHIDNNKPTTSIESDWCETQQTAERQLKVACAYLGFNLIINRSFEKQESRSSNYVRSEWKARGVCGHSA